MPPQQISPSAARRSPILGGDVCGLAKGLGDFFGVFLRVLGPIGGTAGRVDPHHAVRPDADLAERLGDSAAFSDLLQKLPPAFALVHRRPAARGRPHGSDDRADDQPAGLHLVRQLFEVLVRGIDIDVRIEQEQIDPVELLPVHLGIRGVIEHRVQIDRRIVGAGFLADHSGPRGVVELGKIMRMICHRIRSLILKTSGVDSSHGKKRRHIGPKTGQFGFPR